MSLIIYSKDRLYADRRLSEPTTNEDYKLTNGPKLFVNEDKTLAFAACGDIPAEAELPVYFRHLKVIAKNINYSNVSQKMLKDKISDETRKEIKDFISTCHALLEYSGLALSEKFQGKLFVMSTRDTFVIVGERAGRDAIEVAKGPDMAYGTGEDYFFMGSANGVSIPDIYAKGSSFDSTISKEFDTFHRSDLKPIIGERIKK